MRSTDPGVESQSITTVRPVLEKGLLPHAASQDHGEMIIELAVNSVSAKLAISMRSPDIYLRKSTNSRATRCRLSDSSTNDITRRATAQHPFAGKRRLVRAAYQGPSCKDETYYVGLRHEGSYT